MFRYLNVVLLTTAIGSGLGYLSFCAIPADYQSTARIVIASPSEPPAGADDLGQEPIGNRADGDRAVADRVAQAKRELIDTATLQRALENSLLIGLSWPSGGATSLEHVRKSLSIDESDEPADVVVLHCHGPSAEAPQAILSSVIDAYFVRCSQQSQASRIQNGLLLQQARRSIHDMQARLKNQAQLQSLVDALGKPAIDSAAMEHLSQQRAALLLRRNALRRQLAQIQPGKPAAKLAADNRAPAPASAAGSPRSELAAPAALLPGVGAEERLAQLLENDRTLALRYGANHPKRKAVRIEIDLLSRYSAEQAQLLAEQWALLQQFGPDHPRVKEIQQRLDELGIAPLTASGEMQSDQRAAAAGSTEAGPQTETEALQAALQKIDQQDREITRTVEEANQSRELAVDLRQALQSLPAEADLQTIAAALDQLGQLNAAQSATRPYLALRPALGVRSYVGLDKKLLSGAAAGMAVGIVLALAMLLARSAKRSPA